MSDRNFLFLQGPHGPFFWRLGRMLGQAGARCWRVGFNSGDSAFWFKRETYIPHVDPPQNWPDHFRRIVAEKAITDVVLYGDTRPVHAQAVAAARDLGLRIHVFEEGYMRPYWITYERGGANGHSRLMQMQVEEMREALALSDVEVPEVPAHWGDMRHHIFYGALYHWHVMFRNGKYRAMGGHRELPVTTEFALYARRLLLMPWIAAARKIATLRIKHGGFPYHLALMQLEHDASFIAHSPFDQMKDFLELVIEGFAQGAPRHHHLVFKAHPLETGRNPLRRIIAETAARHGVDARVHFVRGGKLGPLLDHARTAVTVNSTAGQQALWRGIPLKTFGDAVYSKPEFVSTQPLPEFFATPIRPDTRAYKDYRRFLLETSQVTGGFYSSRGRRSLLRQVVDMMLDDNDPYDALRSGKAAPRQQLRAVT